MRPGGGGGGGTGSPAPHQWVKGRSRRCKGLMLPRFSLEMLAVKLDITLPFLMYAETAFLHDDLMI